MTAVGLGRDPRSRIVLYPAGTLPAISPLLLVPYVLGCLTTTIATPLASTFYADLAEQTALVHPAAAVEDRPKAINSELEWAVGPEMLALAR